MKSFYKILFLFFLLNSNNISAQVDSKSFNLMGLSDYFINGETKGNTYVFTMYSIKNGPKSTNPKNTTFTLRPLTKETFIKNFFRSYPEFQKKNPTSQEGINITDSKSLIYNPSMTDSAKIKNPTYKLLEDEASKLFYMFVAESIVYDDLGKEPIAGTIYFEDSLLVLRRDFDHNSLNTIINVAGRCFKCQ